MRKNKVSIRTGSSDEFFNRVRGQAEKLDRGESLPAEITITFENSLRLEIYEQAESAANLR